MSYIVLDVLPGERIDETAQRARETAGDHQLFVKFTHNGTDVYVSPGDAVSTIVSDWDTLRRQAQYQRAAE